MQYSFNLNNYDLIQGNAKQALYSFSLNKYDLILDNARQA